MPERLLPPKTHTLAAAVEDQLRTWNKRSPDMWRRSVSEAGKATVILLGELIVELNRFRDEVDRDQRAYDRQRSPGASAHG